MTPFDTANGYAESGGRDLGYHNLARSTAAGRYGITDTTWGGLMRNYPDLGLSWDNRLDPSANQRAHSALTTENTNTLRRNGVANPTTADLGLASFLGPAGATAMLTARPDEAAVDVLTRAVGRDQAQRMLAANPGVLDPSKRVSDILAWNSNRLGGPAHSAGGDGGGDAPPQPSGGLGGPYQATPLPPMPEDFGRPSGPAPGAVAVDRTGRTGDPLIALGMGLMSGGDWRTGMANGLQAYQHAQDQLGTDQRVNATMANAAAEREFKNPAQAAEVAKLRSEAWAKMNPTITPADALHANVSLATSAATNETSRRGQDMLEARARAEDDYRNKVFDQGQKNTGRFVVTNDDGSTSLWQGATDTKGNTRYKSMTSGEESDKLPTGAVSEQTYNAAQARVAHLDRMAVKEISEMQKAGVAAQEQRDQIARTVTAMSNPNANAGPGLIASATRGIMSALGINVTDQDYASMLSGGLNAEKVRDMAKGLGPMSDTDRNTWEQNLPRMGTDPEAAKKIYAVLDAAAARKATIAEKWNSLSPTEQQAQRATGTISPWVFNTNKGLLEAPAPAPAQAQQAAPSGSGPGKSTPPPGTGRTSTGVPFRILRPETQ